MIFMSSINQSEAKRRYYVRHCGPIRVAPILENFPRKAAATICEDMSRKITTSLSTNNRPDVDTMSLRTNEHGSNFHFS